MFAPVPRIKYDSRWLCSLRFASVRLIQQNSCEFFHASEFAWSRMPGAIPENGISFVTLSNGDLLAIGGSSGGAASSGCHIVNRATQSWSSTGSLVQARKYASSIRLPDGKVLAFGGNDGSPLASSEIYDPAIGAWSSVGPLSLPRTYAACVQLPSGRILVAGGFNLLPLVSAEIFDRTAKA